MRKPTLNGTVQKTVHVAVRTAARAEHAVLRTPLAVLDQQVLARVAGHSKLRTAVGRGISALDSAAGSATRRAAPQPASAEPEPIPVEEVEERAAHLLEEQQYHPLAGELAEDDELRRVQAELKAKHAVEAEHESHGS